MFIIGLLIAIVGIIFSVNNYMEAKRQQKEFDDEYKQAMQKFHNALKQEEIYRKQCNEIYNELFSRVQ